MAAVGYATLPIIPALEGIAEKLSAALEKPAAAAAERASGSIEQAMTAAADKASFALKKAREREETATLKVLDLEKQLQVDRDTAARRQEGIAAAELSRDRQLLDSKAKVEAAQRKLDDARASGKATSEDLAELERKVESAALAAAETKIKAEGRVETAVTAHQKALDKVERTTRDYGAAQEDAAKKSESVLTAQKKLDTQTAMTSDEFKAQQGEAEKLARELAGIGSAADEAGKQSMTLGDRLKQGLGTIGKGALLGIGARVGTSFMDAVGESVGRGFKRLNAFDQAEASMDGLGHSADAIDRIMQGVSDSVTGTSFGLDEAAGSGAKLSAVGVAVGEELDRSLKLTADIAAQGRTSMDDISSVMAKAAGNGVLTNEVLGQLDDRATGASAAVAKHMGVSVGEVKKMVTQGKVSFEDFQTAMESHIGGAAQKTGETFKGSLGNMQAALGRFGAKIQKPVFAIMPTVFSAIGTAVDTLGEKLEPVIEEWAERLQPVMERWAEELGPKLVGGIEDLADRIESTFTWIRDNKDVLQAVAVGAGAAAAAWQVWATGIKVHAAAVSIADKGWKGYIASTKIATAVTRVFDKVTKATVIGAIAVALIAVTAALIWFFTKTETGQKIWQKFTDFLKSAWDTVSEKLTSAFDAISAGWDTFTSAIVEGWQTYIQPVLDFIIGAFKLLLVVVTTAVLTPLQIAWNLLWEHWKNTWESVGQPIFEALKSVFSDIGDWISEKIEGIKTKLSEFGDRIAELHNSYVQPYLTLVQAAFEYTRAWISSRIQIVREVLTALGEKIRELYDAYVQPIIDRIKAKFDEFRDKVSAVKDFIVTVALAGIKTALQGFQDFASSIVDGVGTKFGELRQKFARPINFVIRTVYTEGLQKVWNGIAEKVGGVPPLGDIAPVPEFNRGGSVHGPGTGTSDDILARLSNGEHVLTAAEVRALGGHAVVYALREAVNAGRGFTFAAGKLIQLPGRIDNRIGDLAGAAPGLLPAFATGGAVEPLWSLQLQKAHEFAKAQHGKPYQWAGPTGPGSSFDCSGFMGSIAAVIQGTDQWRRYWATMSFPTPGAQGFAPGLGPGFSIGVWNGGPYGGHTSGTLGPAGSYGSVNVESGGSPSMVKYGPGAAGADDPQHKMNFHLPIGADGAFVSGGSLSAEGMLAVIKRKVQETMDSVLGPIKSILPQPREGINALPHHIVDDVPPKVVDEIFKIVEGLGDKLATVYNAVKDVGSLVGDRVRRGASWATERAASAIGLHDEGGWLMPGEIATNRLRKPEPILSPAQWDIMRDMIRQLPWVGESMRMVVGELKGAWSGEDYGMGELSGYVGERTARRMLKAVEAISEQMSYSWDDRLSSLSDHMAGITVNAEGEREQTRGRVGTPEEIAQWAGTELGYGLMDEALGLIGLGGVVPKPASFLDDELRVAWSAPDTGGFAAGGTPVDTVADQAAASTSTGGTGTVVLQGESFTHEQVKKALEELGHKVEDQSERIDDIERERRTATIRTGL